MKGDSLLEIKELRGWKTIAMVERYAHLASQHLKRISTKIDSALGENFASPGTFLAQSIGENLT
jgi:hypothetical protein